MQKGIVSVYFDFTKSLVEPKPTETDHLAVKYQIKGNEMAVSSFDLQNLLPSHEPSSDYPTFAMAAWRKTPEVKELKEWLKRNGHTEHVLRLNSLSSLPEFLLHLYGPLHEMERDLPERLHPENLQNLYFCKCTEVLNAPQFRLPRERLLKDLVAEVEAQHATEGKPVKAEIEWHKGLGTTLTSLKQPESNPKWIVRFNEVRRRRIE